MMGEALSILVWYTRDPQTGSTQVQVERVDTGAKIHLQEGVFLLRILTKADAAVLRCSLQHLNSGRDAYFQSGPKFRDFIHFCLLANDSAIKPTDPGMEDT
jgi:hypothetical protein